MNTLFEREHEYFFHTYKRLPLDVDRGEGVYLFTKDGKRYIDFFGGLAVNALGHAHPKVLQAINDQAKRYIHLSNYYVQEPQVELAERLITTSGFKRIFLSNSGTEAVEGAIKLARKWGAPQGKRDLLGLTNSFHGRTMGALSLTERQKYREGYEPFLQYTSHIPFNDVDALRRTVGPHTLGVILEFIQGEGGIFVVSDAFAKELVSLREKFGFLIIADEIQAGIGRTGKFFGYEHFGVIPDIIVVAKAIGGGLPLGGFLGNERVADVLSYGAHGTTFGGNPVACAAGVVVFDEIVKGGLMQHAARIGEYLKEQGEVLRKEFPTVIKEVRGHGCMLGIDLHSDAQPVVDALQERGILANCTNSTVIRLLPPLTIQRSHVDELMTNLRAIIAK